MAGGFGAQSRDTRHAVSATAGSRCPYWLLRTRRADICEVGREHGERRGDNKVVMAASRLQAEPASRARLEDELRKLLAQEIAPGRLLGDSQGAAPHGGAEPLDQPRLADDQAVSLRRAGERAIAADQADADVRRCFRQQFRGGVAEAALIEDEEVEPGEVRCDQANCWRNGACGRRSAALTVSRSGSTSRSTRALWSERRARSRPARRGDPEKQPRASRSMPMQPGSITAAGCMCYPMATC